MGFREMAAAMDRVQGLKTSEKFCLAMIADRTYVNPETWGDMTPRAVVYVAELCRRTEQSRASIQRHLASLEERGLIFRDRQWGTTPSGRPTVTGSVIALNLAGIERGDFLRDDVSTGQDVSLKMRHTENPFDVSTGQDVSLKMRHTDTCESQNEAPCVSKTASVCRTGEIDKEIKEINDPPLPPTEEPVPSAASHVEGEGRASRVDGAVAPGIEDHKSEPMTASSEEASGKADTTLIDRCLPPEMRRGLAPRHREQLARMLAERLTKGWSEQAICETLTSRELPPQVRSLYGLVRARLERDVPPDSPVAPVSCDDSAAGQTVPVYKRSDGSAVPGWAVCWGDVAVEWGSAQASGQCGPDMSKQEWLSTQACDRFIDELKLRRGRRA